MSPGNGFGRENPGPPCDHPRSPALLEIVPALLFSRALNGLAFTLLAFGAHMPSQRAEVAPAGPADAQVSVDVRKDLKLPSSTASVYLRKALAYRLRFAVSLGDVR